MDKIAYRPLRDAPRISALISAIAVKALPSTSRASSSPLGGIAPCHSH
jgi:hypothetical protein